MMTRRALLAGLKFESSAYSTIAGGFTAFGKSCLLTGTSIRFSPATSWIAAPEKFSWYTVLRVLLNTVTVELY
jgi:hypothetical protein